MMILHCIEIKRWEDYMILEIGPIIVCPVNNLQAIPVEIVIEQQVEDSIEVCDNVLLSEKRDATIKSVPFELEVEQQVEVPSGVLLPEQNDATTCIESVLLEIEQQVDDSIKIPCSVLSAEQSGPTTESVLAELAVKHQVDDSSDIPCSVLSSEQSDATTESVLVELAVKHQVDDSSDIARSVLSSEQSDTTIEAGSSDTSGDLCGHTDTVVTSPEAIGDEHVAQTESDSNTSDEELQRLSLTLHSVLDNAANSYTVADKSSNGYAQFGLFGNLCNQGKHFTSFDSSNRSCLTDLELSIESLDSSLNIRVESLSDDVFESESLSKSVGSFNNTDQKSGNINLKEQTNNIGVQSCEELLYSSDSNKGFIWTSDGSTNSTTTSGSLYLLSVFDSESEIERREEFVNSQGSDHAMYRVVTDESEDMDENGEKEERSAASSYKGRVTDWSSAEISSSVESSHNVDSEQSESDTNNKQDRAEEDIERGKESSKQEIGGDEIEFGKEIKDVSKEHDDIKDKNEIGGDEIEFGKEIKDVPKEQDDIKNKNEIGGDENEFGKEIKDVPKEQDDIKNKNEIGGDENEFGKEIKDVPNEQDDIIKDQNDDVDLEQGKSDSFSELRAENHGKSIDDSQAMIFEENMTSMERCDKIAEGSQEFERKQVIYDSESLDAELSEQEDITQLGDKNVEWKLTDDGEHFKDIDDNGNAGHDQYTSERDDCVELEPFTSGDEDQNEEAVGEEIHKLKDDKCKTVIAEYIEDMVGCTDFHPCKDIGDPGIMHKEIDESNKNLRPTDLDKNKESMMKLAPDKTDVASSRGTVEQLDGKDEDSYVDVTTEYIFYQLRDTSSADTSQPDDESWSDGTQLGEQESNAPTDSEAESEHVCTIIEPDTESEVGKRDQGKASTEFKDHSDSEVESENVCTIVEPDTESEDGKRDKAKDSTELDNSCDSLVESENVCTIIESDTENKDGDKPNDNAELEDRNGEKGFYQNKEKTFDGSTIGETMAIIDTDIGSTAIGDSTCSIQDVGIVISEANIVDTNVCTTDFDIGTSTVVDSIVADDRANIISMDTDKSTDVESVYMCIPKGNHIVEEDLSQNSLDSTGNVGAVETTINDVTTVGINSALESSISDEDAAEYESDIDLQTLDVAGVIVVGFDMDVNAGRDIIPEEGVIDEMVSGENGVDNHSLTYNNIVAALNTVVDTNTATDVNVVEFAKGTAAVDVLTSEEKLHDATRGNDRIADDISVDTMTGIDAPQKVGNAYRDMDLNVFEASTSAENASSKTGASMDLAHPYTIRMMHKISEGDESENDMEEAQDESHYAELKHDYDFKECSKQSLHIDRNAVARDIVHTDPITSVDVISDIATDMEANTGTIEGFGSNTVLDVDTSVDTNDRTTDIDTGSMEEFDSNAVLDVDTSVDTNDRTTDINTGSMEEFDSNALLDVDTSVDTNDRTTDINTGSIVEFDSNAVLDVDTSVDTIDRTTEIATGSMEEFDSNALLDVDFTCVDTDIDGLDTDITPYGAGGETLPAIDTIAIVEAGADTTTYPEVTGLIVGIDIDTKVKCVELCTTSAAEDSTTIDAHKEAAVSESADIGSDERADIEKFISSVDNDGTVPSCDVDGDAVGGIEKLTRSENEVDIVTAVGLEGDAMSTTEEDIINVNSISVASSVNEGAISFAEDTNASDTSIRIGIGKTKKDVNDTNLPEMVDLASKSTSNRVMDSDKDTLKDDADIDAHTIVVETKDKHGTVISALEEESIADIKVASSMAIAHIHNNTHKADDDTDFAVQIDTNTTKVDDDTAKVVPTDTSTNKAADYIAYAVQKDTNKNKVAKDTADIDFKNESDSLIVDIHDFAENEGIAKLRSRLESQIKFSQEVRTESDSAELDDYIKSVLAVAISVLCTESADTINVQKLMESCEIGSSLKIDPPSIGNSDLHHQAFIIVEDVIRKSLSNVDQLSLKSASSRSTQSSPTDGAEQGKHDQIVNELSMEGHDVYPDPSNFRTKSELNNFRTDSELNLVEDLPLEIEDTVDEIEGIEKTDIAVCSIVYDTVEKQMTTKVDNQLEVLTSNHGLVDEKVPSDIAKLSLNNSGVKRALEKISEDDVFEDGVKEMLEIKSDCLFMKRVMHKISEGDELEMDFEEETEDDNDNSELNHDAFGDINNESDNVKLKNESDLKDFSKQSPSENIEFVNEIRQVPNDDLQVTQETFEFVIEPSSDCSVVPDHFHVVTIEGSGNASGVHRKNNRIEMPRTETESSEESKDQFDKETMGFYDLDMCQSDSQSSAELLKNRKVQCTSEENTHPIMEAERNVDINSEGIYEKDMDKNSNKTGESVQPQNVTPLPSSPESSKLKLDNLRDSYLSKSLDNSDSGIRRDRMKDPPLTRAQSLSKMFKSNLSAALSKRNEYRRQSRAYQYHDSSEDLNESRSSGGNSSFTVFRSFDSDGDFIIDRPVSRQSYDEFSEERHNRYKKGGRSKHHRSFDVLDTSNERYQYTDRDEIKYASLQYLDNVERYMEHGEHEKDSNDVERLPRQRYKLLEGREGVEDYSRHGHDQGRDRRDITGYSQHGYEQSLSRDSLEGYPDHSGRYQLRRGKKDADRFSSRNNNLEGYPGDGYGRRKSRESAEGYSEDIYQQRRHRKNREGYLVRDNSLEGYLEDGYELSKENKSLEGHTDADYEPIEDIKGVGCTANDYEESSGRQSVGGSAEHDYYESRDKGSVKSFPEQEYCGNTERESGEGCAEQEYTDDKESNNRNKTTKHDTHYDRYSHGRQENENERNSTVEKSQKAMTREHIKVNDESVLWQPVILKQRPQQESIGSKTQLYHGMSVPENSAQKTPSRAQSVLRDSMYDYPHVQRNYGNETVVYDIDIDAETDQQQTFYQNRISNQQHHNQRRTDLAKSDHQEQSYGVKTGQQQFSQVNTDPQLAYQMKPDHQQHQAYQVRTNNWQQQPYRANTVNQQQMKRGLQQQSYLDDRFYHHKREKDSSSLSSTSTRPASTDDPSRLTHTATRATSTITRPANANCYIPSSGHSKIDTDNRLGDKRQLIDHQDHHGYDRNNYSPKTNSNYRGQQLSQSRIESDNEGRCAESRNWSQNQSQNWNQNNKNKPHRDTNTNRHAYNFKETNVNNNQEERKSALGHSATRQNGSYGSYGKQVNTNKSRYVSDIRSPSRDAGTSWSSRPTGNQANCHLDSVQARGTTSRRRPDVPPSTHGIMRIQEHRDDKKWKDGPLSLTDTYGPMENHNDTTTNAGPALSQSSNQLSGSMASLSNRQAPASSPSRQNTLQKQQSLQSTQSEVNGGQREEEGIKFERLKNLTEDDLMAKIKEIIGHFEKLEEYHRGDGMRIQKMLGDMYWDYPHMREMVGDCMAENGYAVVSMTMLKTLNGIGIFKNDDVWFPTYYTYNTMWNFTDASSKLAKALSEHDAVRLLTLNCGHKPYINAIHSKNVFYVIKASLSILHNIARNTGMKHLFDENKTSEVIMPFIESEDEMLKILATLTISNIVDEEENKTLIAETGTIHCIISWIEKALGLPRRRYKGFTPQELTEGLNKLAVNDSNKMRIIDEGALPLFLKMLQHDDVREQSSAARVIWTLSFDKDVRQKINDNPELLQQLQKLTESTNKSLQTNTQGALWVIRGDNDVTKESSEEKEKNRPRSAKTKTHVFLSYSWSDKEAVLMLRDRLRAEGYAIWIDIEKMGGSTLEAMATAVENSAVVLMCMSEKYKQSPNCRTEAEYTFQLRKDYIPLMLQKRYRPDGWLSLILGAKLYFDFSGKYPFDKSFQGLLKELRGRGKVTPDQTPGEVNDNVDAAFVHSVPSLTSHPSAGTPVHQMSTNSAILGMGQEELIKWLRNIKLTECIPAFMEFDGKLLMQLKYMRSEAPEFFYQCLEKRMNMSLIEILKFTRALEELH